MRRMWAMLIHASLEAMDFSQSFASRRQHPSHAKVRSTPPPPGEDFEAAGGVGALDDFERPLADPVEGGAQLRSGIASVGEQVAQPKAVMAYGFQHSRCSVAILNIGGMNDEPEEHAGSVDDSVALAAPGSGSGAGS